uniref:Uncharacterized protein n=1 Tax=Daphnia galeata TaxID=27404 RepID=A0A8J2W6C1_9CRUS|nr:unnamed protein product [Daphnia galeata]
MSGIDVKTIRIVVFASLFGIAILCAVAVCTFLLYRRLTSSKWTVRPATTRIKIRNCVSFLTGDYLETLAQNATTFFNNTRRPCYTLIGPHRALPSDNDDVYISFLMMGNGFPVWVHRGGISSD